jgi:hypothetical protein
MSNVPRVAENGPVQVFWFLNKLLLASTVAPRGTVKALALRFDELAVLVQRADGSKVIERYDPLHGTLRSTVAVPKATAPSLSSSTVGTIYHVGNRIYLLSGAKPRLIWKAGGVPIGVSVEGRRIAWAVNINGRGRIVALTIR